MAGRRTAPAAGGVGTLSGRRRTGGIPIGWPERAVAAALPWLEAMLERAPSDAERASLAAAWSTADALDLFLGLGAASSGGGDVASRDECELGAGSGSRILATSRSLRCSGLEPERLACVVEGGVFECSAWLAARGAEDLAAAVIVSTPGDCTGFGDGAKALAATLSAVGIPWVVLEEHRQSAGRAPEVETLELFLIGRYDTGASVELEHQAARAGGSSLLGDLHTSARVVREDDRIALIRPRPPDAQPPAVADPSDGGEARQERAARHRQWVQAVRTAVRARGMLTEAIGTALPPWSAARRILRRHAPEFGLAATEDHRGSGEVESVGWVAIASPEAEPELAEWFASVGLDWIGVGRVTGQGATGVAWQAGDGGSISLPATVLDGPAHAVLGTHGERVSEAPTGELLAADPVDSIDAGDPDLGLLRVGRAILAASDPRLLEQIDWLAGGRSAVSPGGGAGVLRWGADEPALAVTAKACPRYDRLDPYVASCIALGEAARTLVASGAEPLAVWATIGLSDDSPAEAELARAQQSASGLRDAAHGRGVRLLGTRLEPRRGVREPAGAGTSVAGLGRLVGQEPLRPWFRAPGDVVIVLGRAREELGASLYWQVAIAQEEGGLAGPPPWVDLEAERLLAAVVLRGAERGLLRSARSVADGGLGAALVECCAGDPMEQGGLGARIRMEEGMAPIAWLFGESQARILVSVRRTDQNALRDLAREGGVHLAVIGEVTVAALEIDDLAAVSVADLRRLRATGTPWAIPEHVDAGSLEKPATPG